MGPQMLGDMLNVTEELIQKSCYRSLQVQNFPEKLFDVQKDPGSSQVFFSFPGSSSVDSWYIGDKAFGETVIDLQLFPSMKSIGNYDEMVKPHERESATAFVNQAFQKRFKHVLESSNDLKREVQDALKEQKSIIFTGHSTGGAIAVLATIWFLENYSKVNRGPVLCVTFGSPLVGNYIISHALRREGWSQYFIHFVMRYDIVPRILFAPLLSIQQEFKEILRFFDPKSDPKPSIVSLGTAPEDLYTNVMMNASSLTSNVASKLMGSSTNLFLETFKQFIELSPYKPFGTYVFYTGNGKLVVSKNPEVVLQILLYSCQLNNETDRAVIAQKCLHEHSGYGNEFQGTKGSSNMKEVVDVDELDELNSNDALDDLGLNIRARLCLRAAKEFEKQKQGNERKMVKKVCDSEKEMKRLKEYQEFYEHSIGYYDAFKLQDQKRDFEANVSRLMLAGIWDEIIDMLKIYDLPDEFEANKLWIQRGTMFRRLVEPLDIANYYRHSKGEGKRIYLEPGGRPKRYRYTQRWLEHEKSLKPETCGESCFWAEVEELLLKHTGNKGAMSSKSDRILELQRQVREWIQNKEVGKDVLLEGSTYVKLLNELPSWLKLNP